MNEEEIKEKIQLEIEKTEKAIIEYKEMSKPISPENAIGRVARMDAIVSKSVSESALREAEARLTKLKHAATKVGDKDFGICTKCQDKIPLGRILLVPQSRFCVRCAR